MKYYEVKVEVTYKVEAKDIMAAHEYIELGAEFPVIPYNDNTYCDTIRIIGVKELDNADLPAISNS